MGEVEAQQPTSQEKEEPQQKEEVVAGESEPQIEEVIGEVIVVEEEKKEVPEVDETTTEAEATTETEVTAEEETTGEEETAEEPKVKIEDIKTAPIDFRFPTTNQTRHCFTRYIEYHKCIAAKGEGASECDKFARDYRSLCPGEWIDRWNEQRENGTFPGPL